MTTCLFSSDAIARLRSTVNTRWCCVPGLDKLLCFLRWSNWCGFTDLVEFVTWHSSVTWFMLPSCRIHTRYGYQGPYRVLGTLTFQFMALVDEWPFFHSEDHTRKTQAQSKITAENRNSLTRPGIVFCFPFPYNNSYAENFVILFYFGIKLACMWVNTQIITVKSYLAPPVIVKMNHNVNFPSLRGTQWPFDGVKMIVSALCGKVGDIYVQKFM